eukprot:3935395-Rhodomonas_salina.5
MDEVKMKNEWGGCWLKSHETTHTPPMKTGEGERGEGGREEWKKIERERGMERKRARAGENEQREKERRVQSERASERESEREREHRPRLAPSRRRRNRQ